ncbi:MAG: ergosterol biosynthesis protein [Thelocarpon impressellum]|nr:MAG: ergosterol biosynthesis protein [Thelocarpon impressellum]
MASTVYDLIPSHEGLLPKWLLLISVVAMLNSAQSYSTLSYTKRLYSAQEALVNPLSAHIFGTWTVLASLIRLYAAYHIGNPQLYELAIWANAVGFLHFTSEWAVFRTARWGTPLAGPVIVSSVSLVWMLSQRSYYVRDF